VALRYIRDVTLAEDMVQDIFVALWEKQKEIRIRTSLKHYLFTAVRNHALNIAQRDKSANISLSELLTDPAVENAEEQYDDELLAVKIAQAVGELPAGCRKIFDLAYREKLSYQQIADQLNISKNTVKTQMGIAYRQLRDKLRKWAVVLLQISLY
jgi:RNA polymerase sigma-70 factor (ECF subfamily)